MHNKLGIPNAIERGVGGELRTTFVKIPLIALKLNISSSSDTFSFVLAGKIQLS